METYARDFGYQPPIVREAVTFKEQIEYKISAIPLGIEKYTGNILTLNMKKSADMCIIGKKGGGKSVIMSGLMDRAFLSGAGIFNIDLKGEYVNKYMPLQKSMQKFLLKTEQPRGIDINSYYPLFFSMSTRYSPSERESYFQFSLSDISKEDLLTMLAVKMEDKSIIDFFTLYFDKIREADSNEDVLEIIRSGEEKFSVRTIDVIIRKMENLFKSKVIGTESEPVDPVEDINNGIFFNLNLKGFLDLKSFNDPASAYIAVLMRSIYRAKVFKRIQSNKHVIIGMDECNKYVPKSGETSAKQVALDIIDLARSEKISLWYSTQDHTRIPPTMLEQARYVMIPFGMNLDEASDILRQVLPGRYDRFTFKSKVSRWLREMKAYKDGRRDWMIVDRKKQDFQYVIPFVPVSNLTQEGD